MRLLGSGRERQASRIGYAADFCPICHGAQVFAIDRIGPTHYGVGQGRLAGHERICLNCTTAFQTDPGRYRALAERPAELDVLQAETFPNLDHVHHDQLELVRRIEYDPFAFPPAERHGLIRNVLLCLSEKVERHFSAFKLDYHTGLALAAALVLCLIGPMLLPAVPVVVFMVLGAAVVSWHYLTSGRRYMRQHVLPALARGLRPLKPSADELAHVLAELDELGHKIGKKVVLADLLALLK
ncbi:hypothetical protein [Chitinimonas lacunae]|uniref:Uncharacterized protein n=1 Tax=Chitinimonas lacunae TaxID=1963018 RepID=A0ABV8MQF8_9NEIS